MTIHEPKLTNKQETYEKICVITKSRVTLPPHHISIVPLMPVNHPGKIHTDTLLEMEENPFFTFEQHMIIIPASQKLDHRIPDKFMAMLWKPSGDSISIKRNTTISYMKESDYIEKSQSAQQKNVRDIAEISKDKLPPCQRSQHLHLITTFIQNQK